MADARVIPLHSRGAGEPERGGANETSRARGAARHVAEPATSENAQYSGEPTAGTEEDSAVGSSGWEDEVADALAFVRRRLLGDYDVDDFGFDPEFADRLFFPALRPFYEKWFRVETFGLENVPGDGAALVVANHSGTLPWDAMMTSVALHDHHPAGRYLRMLGADLVFRLPTVGAVARRAGHTLACQPDAERLLSTGEVAGVWPEGFKGIGKPFKDRYKLQRFGRGGFVSAALRTGAPIVPCAIVGAEETYPKLADIRPIARLLGLPYFPVTPLFPHFGPLGAVPLPSKWYIEFAEPVETASYPEGAADDPMLVFNLSDQVREAIQQTLYRMLSQRANVFLG